MATHAGQRAIQKLTPETASRIAAGEVIERPLSALKEIVENALDAGATSIEIAVDRTLDHGFQVSDNGSGIDAEDLELAFERHATSKIASLEDLDRLVSLGFRGEALPSIAAVSKVRLTSRPKDSERATFVAIEAGVIRDRGSAARAPGTTVEVAELFFNTPARRKFMHSATGELRAALRMIESYALAFPEVAFRLTVDGKERCAWPSAGSVRERAASLWGSRHADQLIEAIGERDGLRVHALLGLPEHGRATREGQVFLVNRRWIQSPMIGHALRQAYGNLLPDGRHPAGIVWLTVDATRLDVNVHPTKREVRFAEDGAVFGLVAATCAKPLAGLHPPFTVVPGGQPEPRWADRIREGSPNQTYLGFESSPKPDVPTASLAASATASAEAAEPELWQLHHTYILAPVRGALVIIDQHAAHERILFEEALARLSGEPAASQQLLFPALIDLSHAQFELLVESTPLLHQLGWDLAPLGPPSVVIRGVPSDLGNDSPATFLQDVLDDMSESGAKVGDVTEHLARSHACHAAIKAGDPLSQVEMRTLVDRLFATSRPHGDPHGRVTFVRLELDELHRRFGRG